MKSKKIIIPILFICLILFHPFLKKTTGIVSIQNDDPIYYASMQLEFDGNIKVLHRPCLTNCVVYYFPENPDIYILRQDILWVCLFSILYFLLRNQLERKSICKHLL